MPSCIGTPADRVRTRFSVISTESVTRLLLGTESVLPVRANMQLPYT
jgi:hypothetical protein